MCENGNKKFLQSINQSIYFSLYPSLYPLHNSHLSVPPSSLLSIYPSFYPSFYFFLTLHLSLSLIPPLSISPSLFLSHDLPPLYPSLYPSLYSCFYPPLSFSTPFIFLAIPFFIPPWIIQRPVKLQILNFV